MIRFLSLFVAMLLVADVADARPLRGRRTTNYAPMTQSNNTWQSNYSPSASVPFASSLPADAVPAYVQTTPGGPFVPYVSPTAATVAPPFTATWYPPGTEYPIQPGVQGVPLVVRAVPDAGGAVEALAEVNARRAGKGLRPYVYDPNLTAGAMEAARRRAASLIQGHLPNDFVCLPRGTSASAGGCAAWSPGMGWGSCCSDDNYTYCGAAYAMGRDGRRYMHLFVR